MKNKHFLCLLLGLVICMSGCNFGGTAQTDAPSKQEQKDEGKTTEIIVPGGKEDKTEEDKKKEEKDDKKQQSKPFWQSETSRHYENLTAVAAAAQQDYRINGAKRGWMR